MSCQLGILPREVVSHGALKYIQRQYVLSEELLTGEKYFIEVYSLVSYRIAPSI